MKSVDTIARVRRAFHVQGWSLKRICRELHVSRNTVRKILRSNETSFSYERKRQPKPKIGPWQDQLDGFLNGNRGKAAREQLTLIRIYEELCSLGYEGGYDAVRRYAKSWAKAQGSATADAYVPLFFAPGEAYQFDWSHEIVLINGVTVTVKVAHVRLCHSRMMFVRAYPRETQEMVFDAQGLSDILCVRPVFVTGRRTFRRRRRRIGSWPRTIHAAVASTPRPRGSGPDITASWRHRHLGSGPWCGQRGVASSSRPRSGWWCK
ncbi:hypothetical protein ATER59S_01838 [Aquamicrobium terrae]